MDEPAVEMGEEVGLEASRVREGIAQELHTLAAELENNVGDDVILSRVKILAENLGELSAITDTDIPNVVIEKLNECIARLENSTRRRLTERGRPSIDIPVETIEFYLLHRVSAAVIAEIFGVSERTIRRRMEEHSIRVTDFFSVISDAELDLVVREIQATHPNCGYRMMIGHLHSQGMRIQTIRVWASLRRVDPEGVRLRTLSMRTIRRRQYSVPAPNAMWHIDGNHKLIRWRFVVHGGIDGFSRMIVYLRAATNNKASTVLDAFVEAVNQFGLPSRVRSDKGGENIAVAHFMVTHRGENRNSHITGRSVHNERIERLWRDVYVHVLDPFHCLFQDLEMEGFLNPDDEVHLFALHWAFHPHLQRHLAMFQDAWNNHKLRTTGSQSPLQLWFRFQDLVDPVEVEEDWEGPYSSNIDSVPVPEVCLGRELSAQQLARLTPPSASFADALDVYIDTVQRVNQIT